eukprot:gene22839-30013_t
MSLNASIASNASAAGGAGNSRQYIERVNRADGDGVASAVTSPMSLKASIASNEGAAGGAGNSRQARQLENRLEKAVMKANEAQSIRHMYEEMKRECDTFDVIKKMKRERDTFNGQIKGLEEASKAATVEYDRTIIEKMKRERDTFDGQIKGLEEASKAATVEYDRIVIASRETNHSKEVAKQDLAAFEEELANGHAAAFEEELAKGRAVRAARLEEMRSNSALVQNTNEALLQRQYPTAIDALKSPGAALGGGADKERQYPTAIDALKSPGAALGGGADKKELPSPPEIAEEKDAVRRLCAAVGATSTIELIDRLLPQQETELPPPPKIAEEKDAVRRLCAAVGATSTIELIDRLLPQQETGNNLKSMRALANRQLKELEGDVLLARKHLEEMKGGSCLSTQAQLDAAEGDLAAATKKAEAARSSHDATMNSYITIRSGLDHLASMVASLPPPAGAAPSMLHGVGTSGGINAAGAAPSMLHGVGAGGGINAAGTLSLGQGSFGQGDEIVSISEALTQCEQRLLAANKFISSLPKAAQLLQDMLGNPDFSFSTTAPSS